MIATATGRDLDELSFYIGRAYYNYKLLLERTLRGLGLDRLVSPGMGHLLFALFGRTTASSGTSRKRPGSPSPLTQMRKMEAAGSCSRGATGGRPRGPDPAPPLGRSIEPRCRKVRVRLNAV
jgi:hypothetical protein